MRGAFSHEGKREGKQCHREKRSIRRGKEGGRKKSYGPSSGEIKASQSGLTGKKEGLLGYQCKRGLADYLRLLRGGEKADFIKGDALGVRKGTLLGRKTEFREGLLPGRRGESIPFVFGGLRRGGPGKGKEKTFALTPGGSQSLHQRLRLKRKSSPLLGRSDELKEGMLGGPH